MFRSRGAVAAVREAFVAKGDKGDAGSSQALPPQRMGAWEQMQGTGKGALAPRTVGSMYSAKGSQYAEAMARMQEIAERSQKEAMGPGPSQREKAMRALGL